jgi:hypothetical protein
MFQLHRVIWLMVYGLWPKGDIDHKNRCKTDNRLTNLREATRSENTANSTARRGSKSGVKGVHERSNGRWRATIMKDYKRFNLGTFSSKKEASSSYDAAARRLFGEFARTSAPPQGS